MKRVLREAFRADLPADIVFRPKCATRDATGVRNVLEDAFGTSRDRYRQVFHDLFRDERVARKPNSWFADFETENQISVIDARHLVCRLAFIACTPAYSSLSAL